MENVLNPIIIDQYYCDSELPCTNQVRTNIQLLKTFLQIGSLIIYWFGWNAMQSSAVKVENISFVHIRGTSATEEAMIFACSDSFPCEGLYLEDIQLVSVSGGITESFCWDSYGSSSGLVYPPPCFSSFSSFINQKFWFKSAVQSLWRIFLHRKPTCRKFSDSLPCFIQFLLFVPFLNTARNSSWQDRQMNENAKKEQEGNYLQITAAYHGWSPQIL